MEMRHTIPVSAVEMLRERVAKLVKKAEKVGAPIPVLTVSEPFEVVKEEAGFPFKHLMVEVTLENALPKIDGFKFAAALAHHQTARGDWENIIRRAPDFADHDFGFNLGTRAPVCEHCGTTRSRSKTYIWQEIATGKMIQIGSACMKDFGGHSIAIWSLDGMEAWHRALEDVRASVQDPPLEMVLMFAYCFVKEYGFKKAREAGSTLDRVNDAITHATRLGQVTTQVSKEEAFAEVPKMLEWLDTQDDASEYIHNLKVAVRLHLTDARHRGLVVSLVAAYERAKAREAEKAAREALEAQIAANASDSLPVVTGKGVTISGTVVSAYTKEYDNGSREVMVVLDDRGFKVWGSVPSQLQDWSRQRFASVGDRVRFVANVEVSDNDPAFGFYKNPRKGEYLAEVTA